MSQLPTEELDLQRKSKLAGLNFPQANGVNLGQPDFEVLLGTREGEDGRENSRIGFTKDDMLGGPHKRANAWYAGTIDLNLDQLQIQYPHALPENVPEPIDDQLGERDINRWFDPSFPDAKPWYDNASGEGVGEGWFYSVLGGGKELRPYSSIDRVPVSFDNTLEASMRGDFAVPTLFNGNFDQYIPQKSVAENKGRNLISTEIPGWSFHNNLPKKEEEPTSNPTGSPQEAQESTSTTKPATTANLVDWKDISSLNTPYTYPNGKQVPGTSFLDRMGINSSDPNFYNYALELKGGDSITHNRFVVPDWGSLRFNIHVSQAAANQHNKLKVTLKDVASGEEITETILLDEANFTIGKSDSFYNNDLEEDAARKLGYATRGFETFNVFDTFYQGSSQQKELDKFRGKTATLKFELEGGAPVYLDDVFFKSSSLKFGEPKPKDGSSPARYSGAAYGDNLYRDNLLLETPQYTLSYNGTGNIPNWASFQINKTSIYLDGESNPSKRGFTNDRSLPPDFYQVTNADYSGRDPYVAGHQTPIASRTITLKDNKAVNMMSNIVPQHKKNNKPIWEEIENYAQDFVKAGREVYVITGSHKIKQKDGQDEVLSPKNPEKNQAIKIPENLWKVMLVLDRPNAVVTDTTTKIYVVGFYVANDLPTEKEDRWRQNWTESNKEDRIVWSLKEIEDEIGYDLFDNLPSNIKDALQNNRLIFPLGAKLDGEDWDNFRPNPSEGS